MVDKEDKVWKKFFKKHFQMFVVWIVAAILAGIGAVYVFLRVVSDALATELVPELLGDWSLGYVITFIFHVIFWELIWIGIPVIVFVAAVYLGWWKKLPDKERKEYKDGHLFGGRNKRSDAGGFFTFIVNIVFLILVYLDDNWDLAFKNWEFDYLVHTYLWALVWVLVIIGIPMLLGLGWWVSTKLKK